MIGPLDITVFTTSVASTAINTEQKARQKWHFLLLISITEYFTKSLVDPQHDNAAYSPTVF